MLGQSALTRASGSASESRVFVFEVAGLRQNDQTNRASYPLRSSSNLLLQVPFSRMNEEMQRISRLGGKIVAIHPTPAASANHQPPSPDTGS